MCDSLVAYVLDGCYRNQNSVMRMHITNNHEALLHVAFAAVLRWAVASPISMPPPRPRAGRSNLSGTHRNTTCISCFRARGPADLPIGVAWRVAVWAKGGARTDEYADSFTICCPSCPPYVVRRCMHRSGHDANVSPILAGRR
jgi:hypothetical protein